MLRIIRYVWIISMLFFLVVLLITHSFSPASVNILDLINMPKEQFFYSFLLAMLLVNSAILVLGNLGLSISKNILFVPKRVFWTSNINTKKIFAENFKLWLKGLALVFNLFFIVSTAAIAKINVDAAPQFTYPFFMLFVGFALVFWLVYYFNWFGNTKEVEKELGLI